MRTYTKYVWNPNSEFPYMSSEIISNQTIGPGLSISRMLHVWNIYEPAFCIRYSIADMAMCCWYSIAIHCMVIPGGVIYFSGLRVWCFFNPSSETCQWRFTKYLYSTYELHEVDKKCFKNRHPSVAIQIKCRETFREHHVSMVTLLG